jgi:DNA-binding NtrC family response regulator
LGVVGVVLCNGDLGTAGYLVLKQYGPLSDPVRPPKNRTAQLIFQGNCMVAIKILLVEDDETQNAIMRTLLEHEGFDITVAGSVAEALKLISSERYDVLLSDLHMPGAADGLTVISHLNPNAIVILLTGFPEMDVAARAILPQADKIMIKGTDLTELLGSIKRRIAKGTAHTRPKIESVATILERAAPSCIEGSTSQASSQQRNVFRAPKTSVAKLLERMLERDRANHRCRCSKSGTINDSSDLREATLVAREEQVI